MPLINVPPFTLPQAPGDWPIVVPQPVAGIHTPPGETIDPHFEAALRQGGTFYQTVELQDPLFPSQDPYKAIVWEKPSGVTEAFSQQEFKLQRTFYVHPYSMRWFLAAYMIGWPRPSSDDLEAKSGIIRVSPQPYPTERFTSRKPLAYCHELIDCKGVTPLGVGYEFVSPDGPETRIGSHPGQFLLAEMTFGYARLPHQVCRDDQVGWWENGGPISVGTWAAGVGALELTLARNVRVAPTPAGKHITFPAGAFRWELGNDPTSQTVGRMLQFMDLNMTWYDVPYVPRAAHTAPGKVNKRPLWGCKANQLLVIGVDVQPHASITGQRLVDITYRLRKFKGDGEQSHNHFLRFGSNQITWDRPVSKFDFGDGEGLKPRYVFDEIEFVDLFRGPWEAFFPL